ncbi:hypothetical protein [Parafilimonas sp.]
MLYQCLAYAEKNNRYSFIESFLYRFTSVKLLLDTPAKHDRMPVKI